jgi:hypothetical protein
LSAVDTWRVNFGREPGLDGCQSAPNAYLFIPRFPLCDCSWQCSHTETISARERTTLSGRHSSPRYATNWWPQLCRHDASTTNCPSRTRRACRRLDAHGARVRGPRCRLWHAFLQMGQRLRPRWANFARYAVMRVEVGAGRVVGVPLVFILGAATLLTIDSRCSLWPPSWG